MKPAEFVLLAALLVVLAGCKSTRNPLDHIPTTEGFEAFDTPRSFHGPGTVLRRSTDDKLHLVGVLELPIVKGNESFPKRQKKRKLKLGTVLKTIGIPAQRMPGALELLRERTFQVNITPFEGCREMVDDRYTKQLDGFFADREVYPDDRYYIIRETISSREVRLHTSDKTLAKFRADPQMKDWVDSDTSVEFDDSSHFGFSKTFDSPMRILYKPERLSLAERPGAGPNQFQVSVQKASPGELLISDEVPRD